MTRLEIIGAVRKGGPESAMKKPKENAMKLAPKQRGKGNNNGKLRN